METKLLVITMIGGLDLVGEIVKDTSFPDLIYIHRPFAMHAVAVPAGKPAKIKFVDMMRTGLFSGDVLVLKTSCIMWSGPPGPQIEKAYAALRAGIVLPAAQDISLNQ